MRKGSWKRETRLFERREGGREDAPEIKKG